MSLHKSTQILSKIATFFKQNDDTRTFLALTLHLWRKIEVRSDHRNSGEVCLIIDDTDQPKRRFCQDISS
ncbi:MAG: hypothetical protein SNF92_09025 [Rikenellaceae bacterium]